MVSFDIIQFIIALYIPGMILHPNTRHLELSPMYVALQASIVQDYLYITSCLRLMEMGSLGNRGV